MMRLIAIVAAVAAIHAFAVEAVKVFETQEPTEKTYVSPDGVNVITERTDSLGLKTYSTTLAHVCDCGTVNCGVMTNDPSEVKGRNVIERKMRSPLGKEIDALGKNLTVAQIQAWNRDAQMLNYITNLASRVEKLENAEAKRQALRDEAKKRAKERKQDRETKNDVHQTLQEAIRRGKRVEKKEAK